MSGAQELLCVMALEWSQYWAYLKEDGWTASWRTYCELQVVQAASSISNIIKLHPHAHTNTHHTLIYSQTSYAHTTTLRTQTYNPTHTQIPPLFFFQHNPTNYQTNKQTKKNTDTYTGTQYHCVKFSSSCCLAGTLQQNEGKRKQVQKTKQ